VLGRIRGGGARGSRPVGAGSGLGLVTEWISGVEAPRRRGPFRATDQARRSTACWRCVAEIARRSRTCTTAAC